MRDFPLCRRQAEAGGGRDGGGSESDRLRCGRNRQGDPSHEDLVFAVDAAAARAWGRRFGAGRTRYGGAGDGGAECGGAVAPANAQLAGLLK